jgi:hypothetical protein
MNNLDTPKVSAPTKELLVKMVVSSWEAQNERVNKLISSLTDEELLTEVATNRNRGIYILGHLAAVNDNMLPLLGFGEKVHPHLYKIFIENPDKAVETPTIADVKKYWNEINTKLTARIKETDADEWFTRHNSVSDEDFAKEPHRNKLSILVSRANHASYHLGQLTFLTKRAK